VIDKTKILATHLLLRREHELTADDVTEARRYIAGYWKNLKRVHTKDDEHLLGLPKPYLVPADEPGHEFDFNELYYWDSYFMIQGLLDSHHQELVGGILEDLVSLFERFGIIPNASRTYLTSHSQPPLLTSLIFDVYDTYEQNKHWLKRNLAVAQAEYQTVWMGTAKPNWRQVHRGLSRYYDINMLNDLAEAESGWDMTPRFNRKALDYLPVDLNSLLYKYETDFARGAQEQGDKKAAEDWHHRAKQRKSVMNDLMWDKLRGFYYDYNYVKEKQGNVSSLAGYLPMWAGLASKDQAKRMVKNLRRFEEKGGLSATDSQPFIKVANGAVHLMPGALPQQWAYPNGWAPLHFIVVKGLQNYGYHEDARRIAMKWLKTCLDWFNYHGVFLEKYNVVQPGKPPAKGLYPSQTGFGWTNAVFERFCREFIDINT
jgi:alpha,alpha-trehalase